MRQQLTGNEQYDYSRLHKTFTEHLLCVMSAIIVFHTLECKSAHDSIAFKLGGNFLNDKRLMAVLQ